jgi:hypothetical protein
MIFSQTPFPALQKYYIGGHFNHVYVYNTTSGELEAKSVNNIATFDGAKGVWDTVGEIGTDGPVNEIHIDPVKKNYFSNFLLVLQYLHWRLFYKSRRCLHWSNCKI